MTCIPLLPCRSTLSQGTDRKGDISKPGHHPDRPKPVPESRPGFPYWLFARGKRVHVTQPRRIAARSLSHYLASVTSTAWGKEIGYQTGFESRKSAATSLLYLTDGVQMARRSREPELRFARSRRDSRMEPESGGIDRIGQGKPGKGILPAHRETGGSDERHAESEAAFRFPESGARDLGAGRDIR